MGSNKHAREAYKRGQKVMGDLSLALNSMAYKDEVISGMASTLLRDHKLLQAYIVEALLDTLREYGMEAKTDPRNQDAVSKCLNLNSMLIKEEESENHFRV